MDYLIKPKIKQLIECRIKAGLTMRDLGKKSGVNVSSICNIEAGRTMPNPSTAKKLRMALEKEFDDLFEIVECKEGEQV